MSSALSLCIFPFAISRRKCRQSSSDVFRLLFLCSWVLLISGTSSHVRLGLNRLLGGRILLSGQDHQKFRVDEQVSVIGDQLVSSGRQASHEASYDC